MKDGRGTSNGRPPSVHPPKAESVREALETYTDEIIETELELAYDRLEASESLSPETIAVISRMAIRISEGIMAGPKATLEEASDPEVRGTVDVLFELDLNRKLENDEQIQSDDISIDS